MVYLGLYFVGKILVINLKVITVVRLYATLCKSSKTTTPTVLTELAGLQTGYDPQSLNVSMLQDKVQDNWQRSMYRNN